MTSDLDRAFVLDGKLRLAFALGVVSLGAGSYLVGQVYPFDTAFLVGACLGLVLFAVVFLGL